ncbi:hypothetical protein C7974DRAFT_38854 [Boeremia exigua]|uniref:uncharacterized protein n=1 Tax=Boeremia exigua TaxID=749465 RepID=UPI001E8CBB6E|nr:uncharacterized protein C7974DRAFT_38854 [Boeremia exigua]KAH6618883.1 hypothetical protein C7974DRAFT_38854 [Boeremia exigua]
MALHGSTSKETAGSTEANRPTDNTPKAEPGSVTFGQPSIIKPLYSANPLFGRNTSKDPISTCKSSGFNFNTVTPIPHLEAYIVRPMMQSTDAACTLSFGIESLRISEHALQAKVQNLGPDYSIMDELLDLQPQMLNLIQSRTAQRQGNIVSVEYGKSVELTTLIGSLQFKPAVFIISTTTVLPQNPLPNPTPTCTPSKFESKQNGNPSLFDKVAPAFGFASTNLSPATVSRHHPSAAEAYSTRLQEQGESCTHVESSEGMGLAHYQTMTTNKSWHDKDRSLEEIRLADYEAGRDRPMKTNGISYPWDAAPARFAPPTKVEFSKTGWFPVNIVASNPGYGFAPAASKVEKSTQNGKASPYLPSDMAPSKPSSFQELWPALPPFVPPQSDKSSSKLPSGMATSGPGLFQRLGGPPSVPPREPFSNTVCTLQHQHGLFCRTSTSQGKTSASTTADTMPSPFASLATVTPKQCHFDSAATNQTAKSPFAKRPDIPNIQFGGSAPVPSGASMFPNNNDANSNIKHPSGRPTGCSSCSPTPSCALFGGNTSQPVTQQRSLFETSGTAPASPPRQALFGGTTGQPITQQRALFENSTTAPAPPPFGGMAAKSGPAGPPA